MCLNFKFFIGFTNRYIETPLTQNKNCRLDIYLINHCRIQHRLYMDLISLSRLYKKTSDFHLVLMPKLDFSYEVFLRKCDKITNRIRKKNYRLFTRVNDVPDVNSTDF